MVSKKSKKGKQRLDRYYYLAKEHGYRSRSAFKLIQLAQKFPLFKDCRVIIDLCAAPGGWLQVSLKNLPIAGKIIGVDLVPIKPIKGVVTFASDITTAHCRSLLKKELQDEEADLVLHDGSPNVGTAWIHDAYAQNELVLRALKIATDFLREGGTFVSKIFRSADYNSLLWVFNQLFKKVTATKPSSSRNESAEMFCVCAEFKAGKIDPRLFDPKSVFLSVETTEDAMKVTNDVLKGTSTSLSNLLKLQGKRNRGGYEAGDDYRECSLKDFVASRSPAEVLIKYHKILVEDEFSDVYKHHKLTTASILENFKDLKVLGKGELNELLKWRFKIRKALGIVNEQNDENKQENVEKEEEGVEEEEEEGEENADDDANEEEAVDDSAGEEEIKKKSFSEDRILKEIDRKIDDLSEQLKKEKRRSDRKLVKRNSLEFKRLRNPHVAPTAGLEEFDMDLFHLTSYAADILEDERAREVTEEEWMGEDKNELNDFDRLGLVTSISEEAPKEEEEFEGTHFNLLGSAEDDSLDRTTKLEIELSLLHKMRKESIDSKSKLGKAMKKRQLALKKKSEEITSLNSQLQRDTEEALKTFKDEEENDDEDEEDDEDEDEEDEKTCKKASEFASTGEDEDEEEFEGDFSKKAASVKKKSTHAKTLLSDVKADRWFSKDIFQTVERMRKVEGVDDGLEEGFAAATDENKENDEELDFAEEKEREYNASSSIIRELADEDLPFLPLSEKQKRKLKRKKAAEEGKVQKRMRFPEDDAANDGKFIEVPAEEEGLVGGSDAVASPVIKPSDPDELSQIQAMGYLMIRRQTRNDLIDGAYNRYAYFDDGDLLPEWFVEDETKHNKPELPVTKELVKRYREKMKQINERPSKKVMEAKMRKGKKMQRRLAKIRQQAERIADDEEYTESGKTKSVQKMINKVHREFKEKKKVYVVSRRVGGGKVAQKQTGKGKDAGNSKFKVVDRRLKKDKRNTKIAVRKSKGGKRRRR